MSTQTQGQIRLVRYFTKEGVKCAFTRRGRKFLKVVTIDSPISVTKVRLGEERYMTPLRKGDNFYPYKRAVSKFSAVGRRNGITKGARQILAEARAQGSEIEDFDLDQDSAID